MLKSWYLSIVSQYGRENKSLMTCSRGKVFSRLVTSFALPLYRPCLSRYLLLLLLHLGHLPILLLYSRLKNKRHVSDDCWKWSRRVRKTSKYCWECNYRIATFSFISLFFLSSVIFQVCSPFSLFFSIFSLSLSLSLSPSHSLSNSLSHSLFLCVCLHLSFSVFLSISLSFSPWNFTPSNLSATLSASAADRNSATPFKDVSCIQKIKIKWKNIGL